MSKKTLKGTFKLLVSLGLFAVPVLASCANAENISYLVRFSYQSFEPNDSKYDDIYGSVSANGRTAWYRPSRQHIPLYKNQTINLGYAIVDFNPSTYSSLMLQANLMDYDSTSPNDTIGNWLQPISLNNVYRDMSRRNSTTSRMSFRQHGEDDADGVMYVDFERR